MSAVMHQKQFEIVRLTAEREQTEYTLDGKSCPLCNHATAVVADTTRRYCLWDRCNGMVLEGA